VFLDGIALVFIIKKQYRLLLYSGSVNLLLLSYQFYEHLRDVVLLNDLAKKKTLKINSFAREMNLEEIPDISVPEIQFGWFFLFLGKMGDRPRFY
jgi:hypothetical protein